MTSRASSSMPWMKVDFPAAQDRQAQRIHPGRFDHSALVSELALLVQHRHVQPTVVRVEPRRPHDAANRPTAQIELQRRRRGDACRLEALGRADVGVASGRAGPLVEGSEQALHLQVGEREHVAEAAREQRPAVPDGGESADQRDAHRVERVEIERRPLGGADQLRGRQSTRPRQVVDLVVALVPEPRTRPSTTTRRGRDRCAEGARVRRPRASPDARTGGSRQRAGRRSPIRRRRGRRPRAGDPGCRSRTA